MIDSKGARQNILSMTILLSLIFLTDSIIGKAYIFRIINTRTASIDIGDGLKLNFSVYWGLDMDQTISISRYFYVFAKEKEEVYRKPYWARGPLYADKNKSHYYMVVRGSCMKECYFFFIVDVANKMIKTSCDINNNIAIKLDYIGQFILITSGVLSGRGNDVSFTPAGQQPEGFNFEADREKLKRWCDD